MFTNFFYELKEAKVPVTLREYLTLLEALDKGVADYKVANFCTAYHVNDSSYYGSIAFWKTPLQDCGDTRGKTCTDYSVWTQKWTEIRG
jgi:hypothetical protein